VLCAVNSVFIFLLERSESGVYQISNEILAYHHKCRLRISQREVMQTVDVAEYCTDLEYSNFNGLLHHNLAH